MKRPISFLFEMKTSIPYDRIERVQAFLSAHDNSFHIISSLFITGHARARGQLAPAPRHGEGIILAFCPTLMLMKQGDHPITQNKSYVFFT